VGYVSLKSPGYPSFASNVLHSENWETDNAGNLSMLSSHINHPLVTIPNALPANLALSYSGYGDQDAQKAVSPAYIIYEPGNKPGDAGLLIYDDNSDTTSAQTIYFAFNLDALSDQSAAKNLLDNSVHYLLTKEGGVIKGTVDLTDKDDDSGVAVYLSGTAPDTVYTNYAGVYLFNGLADGTYSVRPYKDGYTATPSQIDGISVKHDTTADQNFVLNPNTSGLADKNASKIPTVFAVAPNFPNRFNPQTNIRYQLPRNSNVSLTIYDYLGRKVTTLVNGKQAAGYYRVQWNGRTASGGQAASGIYIFRFQADRFNRIQKMILLR